MRILAVDPGTKRLGIAISDPTGAIASPLVILPHASRAADTAAIAELAAANEAGLIIVGQSLDDEGHPTLEGRRAARLAAALRDQTSIPVILWDESLTTQDAREARIAMGVSRKRRARHLDDLAAAVLLQSYLDASSQSSIINLKSSI